MMISICSRDEEIGCFIRSCKVCRQLSIVAAILTSNILDLDSRYLGLELEQDLDSIVDRSRSRF